MRARLIDVGTHGQAARGGEILSSAVRASCFLIATLSFACGTEAPPVPWRNVTVRFDYHAPTQIDLAVKTSQCALRSDSDTTVFLTLSEAAEVARAPISSVRAWIYTNKLRASRPGRRVLIPLGVETPFLGGHSLEPFHDFVVNTLGFAHRMVRTDYAFDTAEAAAQTLGFFFGERMATTVREQGWRVVPECTGAYWRKTVTPPGR